jgi:hypothetical protein
MTLLAIYAVGALIAGAAALWLPLQPLRAWPLLLVAALPQLPALAGLRSPALTLISIIALALWGWRNRHSWGAVLATAGCLLNLGTMLVHGGAMPIHPDTLAQIGMAAPTGTALLGSKDLVADLAATALLGDWIIVPLNIVTLVVSPGDLLVVAGIALWLVAGQKETHHARTTTATHAA